ncbi:MAG TPA: SPOR domain-containing protein [Thermoanaerobaculia bacterium]
MTAAQAFVAFVLLLLSLAASFAFGLLIGRGAADEHLVVRKDAPVISEAVAAPAPKQVVADQDFKAPATAVPAAAPAPQPTIEKASVGPASVGRPAEAAPHTGPVYAQLLSTSDQKTAEGLAAKLIEGGFTAAYVERGTTEKGTVFRVRVKFSSDADAHAAEANLKQFSKEVWITR